MRYYFSGIESPKTYQILEEAGVRYVLVDQFDLHNIPKQRRDTMLDSGAYRAWKKGWTLDVSFYAQIVRDFQPFDQITTLDVFGDNRASFKNWIDLRNNHGLSTMPVWFFSDSAEDEDLLRQYMLLSEVVGIGGLVPKMRAKDKEMLENLLYLCRLFPKRCHLFGLNWLHALHRLKDKIYSADSSKWLDGARYRHLIYFDETIGELVQTPSQLSRNELLLQNALNIEAYCLGLPRPLPENQRPKVNYQRRRVYQINKDRKFQR